MHEWDYLGHTFTKAIPNLHILDSFRKSIPKFIIDTWTNNNLLRNQHYPFGVLMHKKLSKKPKSDQKL